MKYAFLLAALLVGCSGGSSSTAPTPAPTAAPTAKPTATPTATPVPVPAITPFFGPIVNDPVHSSFAFAATSFTNGFAYFVGIPGIGNGASCQMQSLGPWGIQNDGSTGAMNDFSIHVASGILPAGYHGATIIGLLATCTDGRFSRANANAFF